MPESNARMEERRQLFNDPEFPFWTENPSRGHVVVNDGMLCVVLYCGISTIPPLGYPEGTPSYGVKIRQLNADGTDSLGNPEFQRLTHKDCKLKVIDRMYWHKADMPYQVNLIDNEPLYFLSKPLAHEDVLPPDHPLRHIPYWGSPGGKNLTIIACLEWALMHLEFEDKKLPCVENEETLKSLKWAICLQKMRQQTRMEQGVLGTNKPHVSDDIAIKLPKMKT